MSISLIKLMEKGLLTILAITLLASTSLLGTFENH